MAIPDVTATLSVQGVSSEVTIDEAQRFWLNGILFGDAVAVGSFQDTSNLTTSDDQDPIVLRNVKYTGVSSAQVDTIRLSTYGPAKYGEDVYGGSVASTLPQTITLPLSITQCQLHIHLDSDLPIQISAAKFYAYDGVNDTTPFRGINFYAAEAGQTTSWVAANGSTQALTCSNQPSALTHDWFIALSASPTGTGDKQGKIKFVYTYA